MTRCLTNRTTKELEDWRQSNTLFYDKDTYNAALQPVRDGNSCEGLQGGAKNSFHAQCVDCKRDPKLAFSKHLFYLKTVNIQEPGVQMQAKKYTVTPASLDHMLCGPCSTVHHVSQPSFDARRTGK